MSDPDTIALLRQIQPLRVTPETPVFLDTKGNRIEPDNSVGDHWNACLRALRIRPRGLYATKDTFVTLALAMNVPTYRISAQTGVAISTLERHYKGWIKAKGERPILDLMSSVKIRTARR